MSLELEVHHSTNCALIVLTYDLTTQNSSSQEQKSTSLMTLSSGQRRKRYSSSMTMVQDQFLSTIQSLQIFRSSRALLNSRAPQRQQTQSIQSSQQSQNPALMTLLMAQNIKSPPQAQLVSQHSLLMTTLTHQRSPFRASLEQLPAFTLTLSLLLIRQTVPRLNMISIYKSLPIARLLHLSSTKIPLKPLHTVSPMNPSQSSPCSKTP